jgi:anti-sigma regulatory factor (Ser/Thr protein kinase)
LDNLLSDHRTLRAEPSSIRAARRFLTATVSELDLSPDTVSVAELALSEIVTNAVLHGRPPIEVHVEATASQLRVTVVDADPAVPRADETRLDATGGRGLAIVAAVAGRWGCEADAASGGKRVWFTVAT